MEDDFNATIRWSDDESITWCRVTSNPDVEAASPTYVMPGNPNARAALEPTLGPVFSSAAVEPVAAWIAPVRGAVATVKTGAPRAATIERQRSGAIALVVVFGVLCGALLGIALAPAGAHAEGAHAGRTPSFAAHAALPNEAAERGAQAAPPAYDLPAPTTSLAPSPPRMKAASTLVAKKRPKNPASPSELVRAGQPR